MNKVITGVFLLMGLLMGNASMAQNAAIKSACAKLDEEQQLVIQKVTITTGMPRVNAVYYGSFILQAISTVRNSVNALPSGKKVVVTPAQQSAIDDLSTLSTKFSKRTSPCNDSIENETKAIVAKLGGDIPTPDPIKAMLIKAGNQGPFQVKATGNFSLADIDTANVQVDKAHAFHITNNSIDVKLSTEEMGMVGSKESFEWHKYTLKIPYWVTTGKKKKKTAKVATFEFLGCTFPTKPGKIAVTTSKSNGNSEVQHKRTRTFLLNSTRENLVEKQCLPKAESGYTLVPESAQLEIESSKGQQKKDWTYQKTTTNGNICFVVETFYNKGGESGKLEFYLKYDVKKILTAADNEIATENYELEWGETNEIAIAGSKPELVFTDYKGDKTTIEKDTVAPFGPTIKMGDKKITVTAPRIDQLIKPSTSNNH